MVFVLLQPNLSTYANLLQLRIENLFPLQNACRILSPLQYTTQKTDSGTIAEKFAQQSDSHIFTLAQQTFLYTDNHPMRPDGFNSFEVTFLTADDENASEQTPILSTLQIGCLM